MKAEFLEKYVKLSDMMPGEMAISKCREKFFVCGYYYNKLKTGNDISILELNDLQNQYTDRRDMDQPVLILKRGDRFVCSA